MATILFGRRQRLGKISKGYGIESLEMLWLTGLSEMVTRSNFAGTRASSERHVVKSG